MPSVEIIVGHNWTEDIRYLHGLRDIRPAGTSVDLVEIRDIIDIVVDGRNITSNVTEESIFGIMGGLIDALLRLFNGRSRKAIVEFHCEPWELVLIPTDGGFEMSLYGVGHRQRVVAHDLSIEAGPFLEAVTSSARSMLQDLYGISDHFASDDFVQRFSERLASLEQRDPSELEPPAHEDVETAGRRRGSTSSPTGLSLQYTFDADYAPLRHYGGEHAFDLHALLFGGRLEAEYRGHSVVLTRDYPFLCLTSLLERIRELLGDMEAETGGDIQSEGQLEHVTFDVQARRDHWFVELGDETDERDSLNLELPAGECLDVVLTAADMLTDDLLELNRRLELNHRLSDVVRDIRELRDWFEDVSGDNEYFEQPEQYLDESAHLSPRSVSPPEATSFPRPFAHVHRLFADARWEFRAGRLHTSAITPSRRGLLVPDDEGISCLAWEDGALRWRHRFASHRTSPVGYAASRTSVSIPEAGPTMTRLDLASGELERAVEAEAFESWNELLAAAELDSEQLVVAVEREGAAAGFDARNGELRWHVDAGHCRLSGAIIDGPLVSLLTREGVFCTLDPSSGDLLWKVRIGGVAHARPVAHQGRLYAFTHDANRTALTIRAFYAFTGRSVWQRRLEGTLAGPPSFADHQLFVPMDDHGDVVLRAIDIEAPEPDVEWECSLASAGREEPTPVVPVEIEGRAHGLIRTDLAQVTCVRLADGEVRWRVDPEPDTWRRRGSEGLFAVRDAVLTIGETIDVRRLDTGELLHRLDSPIRFPEFATANGALQIVLGESPPSNNLDQRLVGLDLNHFLAEVD